jgi:MFS family permease
MTPPVQTDQKSGWRALIAGERLAALVVTVAGVLLYAMNALLMSTVLPSAVFDIGGLELMTWPTAGYLASSMAAATGAALLKQAIGARHAYALAMALFCLGALIAALAPTMLHLIGGRIVQGIGGGLITALAYVMVRSVFPENLWTRMFAILSAVWGIAVFVGPLVGGAFANAGFWRGAFFSVAIAAALLSAMTLIALPALAPGNDRAPPFPALRLALVVLAIVAVSAAGIVPSPVIAVLLIVCALAFLAAMLRLDRSSTAPLLPSDAFSFASIVGAGLWIVLLLSIANDPFPIFGPLFLQRLHGFDPLIAGYLVAIEALAWTITAMLVAGASEQWASRMIALGPLVMGAGLLGLALFMPNGPVAAIVVAIYLAGAGIGACWSWLAERIMKAARTGESDAAAGAVASVQLFGLALGAALAGLIANLSGLRSDAGPPTVQAAAFWVPVWFVLPTLAAAIAGWRMNGLRTLPRDQANSRSISPDK